MKAIIVFTSLLNCIAFCSNGQSNANSLKGSVRDSIGKTALQGSTILLTNQKDSALTVKTITDINGNFSIKDLFPGNYTLTAEHIGYKSKTVNILVKTSLELSISLLRSIDTLSEVTIFSSKMQVIQSADKITFNVSEGVVSSSDNLLNIILKIPGVTQSKNFLFYQGKPLIILLDNKMNNLSGDDLKEYLSGVTGTTVDKLEILLNPSSKYDAKGGAVFNIKTQRSKNYGLQETVSLGAGEGTYFRGMLGYSFNYRDSIINIYGGYDFNHTKQFFLLHANETFMSNPASINLVDNNIRTQNNNSARLGVDYDLNKKTSVGLSFKGFLNYRHRSVTNTSVYKPAISNNDTVANVYTNTNAVFKSPSLNLYLKTRVGKKGSELNMNGDYFGYDKSWSDDFVNMYSDLSGHTIGPNRYLLDRSPANNSIKSFAADYYHPFKGGKWESGLKATVSRTDNNALWQELVSNTWIDDLGKTNHFVYSETVYASYINFSKSIAKWTIQGGLRYEATRSISNSITLNSNTTNRYENLFPTGLLQYNSGKGESFTLNYRSSIQRFGFDIINPFIVFQSQYSYNQGNPNIKPSFFKSIDLSYSYKSRLLLSIGYSSVTNPISYGYKKDAATNVAIGSYFNFSSGQIFTGNINYSVNLFKGKLISSNAVNVVHSLMPDFTAHIQENTSYSLNTTNTILLPGKLSLEATTFYNSSSLDGTVMQSSVFGVAAGIVKSVLKSKGSLKLSCTDILNTQGVHFFTKGDGIIIASDWKVESRFLTLLFTYKFGNQNVKANKNRRTGIEDEKKRMGAN